MVSERFTRARRTRRRLDGAPAHPPAWLILAALTMLAVITWATSGNSVLPVRSGEHPEAATPSVEGWATYYADAFQGLPMANGRPFDMNDPTITASNDWPLGTVLEVRRVPGGPWDATLSPEELAAFSNERLVVRVTDRGAFNHPLDLSAAAFARLGRPSEGVIRVAVRALSLPTTN